MANKIEKFREFKELSSDPFNAIIANYLTSECVNPEDIIEDAIIQPNEISRACYNCTTRSQKILCLITKKFKIEHRTYENRDFCLSVPEIIKNLNMPEGGSTRTAVKNSAHELMTIPIFIDNEKVYSAINIFEFCEYDKEKNLIYFKFTETFAKLLEQKSKGNFTVLDYQEIINLSSFYAIRLYEIAMSYKGFKGKITNKDSWVIENIKDLKNSWCFGFSLRKLKFMFLTDEMENKYKKDSDLIRSVLEKPIKILNKEMSRYKFQLRVFRENNTPKGAVKGIMIWVTENPNAKKTSASILEINKLTKKLQDENFEVWNNVYNNILKFDKNVSSLSDEELQSLTNDIITDQKKYNEIRKEYPEIWSEKQNAILELYFNGTRPCEEYLNHVTYLKVETVLCSPEFLNQELKKKMGIIIPDRSEAPYKEPKKNKRSRKKIEVEPQLDFFDNQELDRQESDKERQDLERMKNTYPDEFERRFKEKASHRTPLDTDFMITVAVYLSMKEDGFL